MINFNSACPPASIPRFLTTEVAPKAALALVTVVAATALGFLTIF